MKPKRIAAKPAVATRISAASPSSFPAGMSTSPRPAVALVATIAGHLRSFARVAWSLITWPIDWLCDFFGVEPLGGRLLQAEIVVPCSLCSDPTSDYVDGHPPGVQCPYLMVANCAECLMVVDVTRYGFCVVGGARHFVYNLRPKPQPIAPLYIVKEGR